MVFGTFQRPPRAFWGPQSGPQEASRRSPGGPQRPQGSPKEAPRRPQDAPRRPQDAPRRPFGGPEPPPEPPRCPQEASQTPQITPQPLQRSIFVAKRTKTQALLQIFSKYENAQTPRKMHGFEHVQKASSALFGHQKWPHEARRSPPRDPMTPPRRPQDVSHAHQNVPLRLPRGPRRPETFQEAANTYGDIPK